MVGSFRHNGTKLNMFKGIPLINVPNTLKYLGDPSTVGGNNVNLREASETINYTARVKLSTYADSYVGKVLSTDDLSYSGQSKLHGNSKGLLATAYAGMDIFYTEHFEEDPSWVDVGGISTYNDGANQLRIENNNVLTFGSYAKNLGFGNIFNNNKHAIIRTEFTIVSGSSGACNFAIGIVPEGSTNSNGTCGATIYNNGDNWRIEIDREGVQSGQYVDISVGQTYTVDLVYNKTDYSLMMIVYGAGVLVGSVKTSTNYWNSITGNSIGFWSFSAVPNDNLFVVSGMEAWTDTVIVKVSKNNGVVWEKVGNYPVAIEEIIKESAVSVDNSSNIHLVFTQYNGSTYDVKYRVYNVSTYQWSNVVTCNTTTGTITNPTIATQQNGKVHICWVRDGQLLYYTAGGGIVFDDGDIIIG